MSTCASCGGHAAPSDSPRPVSAGICPACMAKVAAASDRAACRTVLNAIGVPILMLQPDPRLVFTANDKALDIFGRDLDEAEGHRGGEVFSCVHSFTALGCGKDANCEDCRIKGAIVATFDGAEADKAGASLLIRLQSDIAYDLVVSTERVGRHALVRIDHFEPSS